MRIPGKRVKRHRLMETDKLVVAVEIELVVPDDDPTDECMESETVEFLRDVQAHADRGDVEWLKKHGKVYAALDAA